MKSDTGVNKEFGIERKFILDEYYLPEIENFASLVRSFEKLSKDLFDKRQQLLKTPVLTDIKQDIECLIYPVFPDEDWRYCLADIRQNGGVRLSFQDIQEDYNHLSLFPKKYEKIDLFISVDFYSFWESTAYSLKDLVEAENLKGEIHVKYLDI